VTTTADNDWISWTGMSIVLVSAAALSFAQLMALAIECGFEPRLAWLLPITIDFGEAVACRVWLRRHTPHAAARFAGVMTWGLLITTIVANGVGHGLAAASMQPPWGVAVAVGAIPPLVVGLSVHLMMLVSRPAEGDDDAVTDEATEVPAAPVTSVEPVAAPVPIRARQPALERPRPVRVAAEVDPDDEPEPENETAEERGKRLARNRSRRARRKRATEQDVEMRDEA
jgi:hypothetical protein